MRSLYYSCNFSICFLFFNCVQETRILSQAPLLNQSMTLNVSLPVSSPLFLAQMVLRFFLVLAIDVPGLRTFPGRTLERWPHLLPSRSLRPPVVTTTFSKVLTRPPSPAVNLPQPIPATSRTPSHSSRGPRAHLLAGPSIGSGQARACIPPRNYSPQKAFRQTLRVYHQRGKAFLRGPDAAWPFGNCSPFEKSRGTEGKAGSHPSQNAHRSPTNRRPGSWKGAGKRRSCAAHAWCVWLGNSCGGQSGSR